MNIYFSGSIAGGRGKQPVYKELIMFLEEFGNVWTKHVGELKSKSEKSVNVYARDITWLDNSDVLVAEITVPSIGVGMEIEHAIRMERKIPILCLFDMNSMKPLTRMVIDCPYVTTFGYPDIESAKTVISEFINSNLKNYNHSFEK